jgi:hypothetical protein
VYVFIGNTPFPLGTILVDFSCGEEMKRRKRKKCKRKRRKDRR